MQRHITPFLQGVIIAEFIFKRLNKARNKYPKLFVIVRLRVFAKSDEIPYTKTFYISTRKDEYTKGVFTLFII